MGDAIIDEEDIKKEEAGCVCVCGGGSCQEVSESAGTPSENGIMKSLFYPGGSSRSQRRSRVRSSCHFDP